MKTAIVQLESVSAYSQSKHYIEPKLDTEVSPKAAPNKFVKMDISNPPQSDVVPREHPVESLFQKPKTVRHQLGRHVPLKISNN